jgi:hypothetical protein
MGRDKVTNIREGEEIKARLKREQYEADFAEFMGTSAGRRLMHRWLQDTGIYTKSYTGNSETFYREGRRSVGLDLLPLGPGVAGGCGVDEVGSHDHGHRQGHDGDEARGTSGTCRPSDREGRHAEHPRVFDAS